MKKTRTKRNINMQIQEDKQTEKRKEDVREEKTKRNTKKTSKQPTCQEKQREREPFWPCRAARRERRRAAQRSEWRRAPSRGRQRRQTNRAAHRRPADPAPKWRLPLSAVAPLSRPSPRAPAERRSAESWPAPFPPPPPPAASPPGTTGVRGHAQCNRKKKIKELWCAQRNRNTNTTSKC
jgi:hypothetical protein